MAAPEGNISGGKVHNGEDGATSVGEAKKAAARSNNSSSASLLSLFQAAKIGDAESIQSAIMNGVDVNARDDAGERC